MRKVPVAAPAALPPEQAVSGRGVLLRWFPQWWGWYAAPGPAPPAPGLEGEILDVIADSLDDNTLLRRDAVFGLFEFTLLKGSLDLCTELEEDSEVMNGEAGGEDGGAGGEGLELQFSSVCLRVEWRPRAGAHALHVSLGGVCLRDRVTPRTLFPVLVAPHGLIREGLGAPAWRAHHPAPATDDPLFQLTYEKRPVGLNCDYKLRVKSSSLEVVWCAAAARWARRWAGAGALARLHTRAALHHHWDRFMRHTRRPMERSSWHVELDISAPQILLVEDLCDRDASVLVLDFGRLRLANAGAPAPDPAPGPAPGPAGDLLQHQSTEEDEEMFMTPCSTPPGSLLSPASPPASPPAPRSLDAAHLHTSLYDRYNIELSELQILVGRARDNWKYAHTKPTSALHLLDRFSISLQAERRVLATADPRYPRLALAGQLPALVAHLSEHKLAAVRAVAARLAPPPPAAPAPPPRPARDLRADDVDADDAEPGDGTETDYSDYSVNQNATLLLLQFSIDQMSLEVQSRGRSIAEVQVCGVRAALGVRAADTSLSLSVHSLLLVDALQTYGPDFELLVASHKHVGMDTTSGSIRGSEPTSPTSPASPAARAPPPPTPRQLRSAIYSLHHAAAAVADPEAGRVSPTPSLLRGLSWNSAHAAGAGAAAGWGWPADSWPSSSGWAAPGLVDSEALIAVELCFVKGEGDSEDLRIANILFNNLDVIANQETIVELIGFAHRVAGGGVRRAAPEPPRAPTSASLLSLPPPDEGVKRVRTEITFDFHRLGVLLLRARLRDGALHASKIATATVGDARIQATLDGERISVGGSLGGVQVVSLSERAGVHTRVLAAGRAPAAPHAARGLHAAGEDKALWFSISRTVRPPTPEDSTEGGEEEGEADEVVSLEVSVRVASVWYTHSAPLLRELRECVAEFQQYLANLARSIRAAAAAAADMAIGLVHPRSETLYSNPRLSHSIEGVSPRRRTTSAGCSLDEPDRDTRQIVFCLSVELESPVVVVPRAARSSQVFVAHLGRMSLANSPAPPLRALYCVRVRDISLVSLDVRDKLVRGQLPTGADAPGDMYDATRGLPVLHDTALQLSVAFAEADDRPMCTVDGRVVDGLHVTASREQYEQLLETLQWLGDSAPDEPDAAPPHQPDPASVVEPAVPTLRLDPQLRAAVLAVPPPAHEPAPAGRHTPLVVTFELENFMVELRADLGAGERSLVALTFREFSLRREHLHPHESMLQVSLHSITMEDLTKDPDSKHRMLMVSHTPPVPPKAVFVSKSCPDFVTHFPQAHAHTHVRPLRRDHFSTSLPSELHVADRISEKEHKVGKEECGSTPPCSPEREAAGPARGDLVCVSVHARRPQHPRFHDLYNKVSKLTKVEFNCLKLVLSIDSWVAVLDFFGIAGDEPDRTPPAVDPQRRSASARSEEAVGAAAAEGAAETEMNVRSLSVVVVGARGDACRALVSRAALRVRDAAGRRDVRARLGALALADLAPRAALWRERLRMRTSHALDVHYQRLSAAEAAEAGHETSLSLEMGPVTYVHTRRFVLELQAFARDFSLLRRVLAQARQKVSSALRDASQTQRMRLRVRCEAPVIVLPVSQRSRSALAAELQLLLLDNCFRRAGDPDTISKLADPTLAEREILDVRTIRIEGLSLRCVRAGAAPGGELRLRRRGQPLLPAPARLALQLERNCSDTHNVPEMTVQGRLATLQLSLDATQYRLIRGVLAHNLAEPCTELLEPPAPPDAPPALQGAPQGAQQPVWTTWSLQLDLQDVCVELRGARGSPPLANINFIKSRLLVESYSDLSQDIDLVSQEILVSDTRYAAEPANRRGNVFSHIVQPMADHRHSVQAEVHARKRQDSSAYTILINNMRLMAILDWWEAANQFIMQPPPPPADPDLQHLEDMSVDSVDGEWGGAGGAGGADTADTSHMEIKLNITDSQLVLVEDASLWDTNAVILKGTTVITYRGAEAGVEAKAAADAARPVVCELSELEVFSCVLGLEEETALSILEPAALHAQLRGDGVLHIQMGALNLRLSYHDMRMFASMLQSLPAQARVALSGKSEENETDAPANSEHMRAAALARGAARPALPRWLRAPPPRAARPLPAAPAAPAHWPLRAVHVNAECVTLCVIDDCLDSDVPLLEVALNELQVEQDLRNVEESFEDPLLVSTPSGGVGPLAILGSANTEAGGDGGRGEEAVGAGGGCLRAQLSVDYYNRILSGWEPVIEPWRFSALWEHTLSSGLARARVQLDVRSADTLDTNLTSALVDLVRLVRTNWTADYYAPQPASSEQSPKGSPAGHRRRSPFVPYALRNLTGHRLWFTTLTTTSEELGAAGAAGAPDDSWVCVRAGDTEPFSFGARRGRGRDARDAPAPLHRLVLRVDGWVPPDPVCVDRVGVFFRTITHTKSGIEARVVLEVSLEGSARKLVAVRSALLLRNALPHPVELRLERAPAHAPALGIVYRVLGVAGALAWGAAVRALRRRAALAALPAMRAPRAPAPAPAVLVGCGAWSGGGGRSATVGAGESWAAPLAARPGAVWARPLPRAGPHAGPPAPALPPAALDWRAAAAAADRALLHHECRAPHDYVYRFCSVIIRERFPPDRGELLAGHTITLVPALRLENLLPLELQYRADHVAGTLAPADTQPFHQVNVEEGVELCVKLEGFGWSTALSVGGAGAAGSFSARLKLRDERGRRLYLNARVTVKKTDGIKVSISAAYWLVNRTGLPLVFRAEGGGEAAGQFAEHELARMVAPLPFSFADGDGPTVSVRLGAAHAAASEWCSPFGLGPGVTVKRLQAAGEERAYAVGVAVRAGRGRYRRTNIVTLAPRYQLHNNTDLSLQFAQKCTATTLNDPGALATHVTAVAGCCLPWHWARWDRERLLCVRVLAARPAPAQHAPPAPHALTAWSGGFRIDAPRSLHIACRESGGSYQILRVEVVSQGAALLVVLSAAAGAPPPLRIDNCSPVAIMFHQVGCTEECVVGAGARAGWALPEPEGAAALALRAPGGPRLALPLQAPAHDTHTLLYQNFIYVAFAASAAAAAAGVSDKQASNAGTSAEDEGVLVLEVPLGSTRVQLARKRYGDRCQLWRGGPNGQLVHEGSSPPQPTDALSDDNTLSPHAMVLDIEEAAPRPGRAAALVLRRADPRRASTQAWRLVAPASLAPTPSAGPPLTRMACAHANLCVQPENGLMGLAPGGRVVLGLPAGGVGGAGGAVPPEQAVRWSTLRPGSGRLAVTLCADGPTRLVRIQDQADPENKMAEAEEEGVGSGAGGREWALRVALAGLSLSLVARWPPAELLYAHLTRLRLTAARAPRAAHLALTVDSMQWDNQLPSTPSPVLLYCLGAGGAGAGAGALPALHVSLELSRAPPQHNAVYFSHFVVALRPIAVRLDERLILLVWSWVESGAGDEEAEEADEAEYETRRVLHELTALHATRYYFALIKIIPSQIRLSMFTASKLEGELAALKRRLGLTFIRFEDAAVELEPFERAHAFDTAASLARHLLQHFKDELKWQAAKILGSVDFLGNPLGFVADVSEGVSGLLLEGNVAALLKNVTHGISNSAAKVSETLGDGLERVVGDEAHEETRRRIRSAAAGAHLAAGLRGLGLGILGGMTSLVKHTRDRCAGPGGGDGGGAARDVAARGGGARARARAPRLAGAGAAPLPRYCPALAEGAALLHALPAPPAPAPAPERFLAYRTVRDTPHDIRALLSDTYLRIVTCKHGPPHVVMETHLSNLVSCTPVFSSGAWYVELGVRGGGAGAGAGGGVGAGGAGAGEALRRPRVQCDSADVARWLATHAAAARQLHHDRRHTLLPHTDL
ncbi:unnamed protein product, partial [Brenthis ino]